MAALTGLPYPNLHYFDYRNPTVTLYLHFQPFYVLETVIDVYCTGTIQNGPDIYSGNFTCNDNELFAKVNRVVKTQSTGHVQVIIGDPYRKVKTADKAVQTVDANCDFSS